MGTHFGEGKTRGGTRGGQGLFKWESLDRDTFRINYLGNSVRAPSGRMTKEKDVLWYEKEKGEGVKEKKSVDATEKESIKKLEADALNLALGILPRHDADDVEKKREEKRERREKRQEKREEKERKRKEKKEGKERERKRVDSSEYESDDERRRRRRRSESRGP